MENLTSNESKILEAIPWGKENSVISDVIVKRARFPETEWRTNVNLRDIIRNLKYKGYSIVSNGKGFWKTKDPEDIKIYIRSLKGRMDAIEATKLAMERILKEMLDA